VRRRQFGVAPDRRTRLRRELAQREIGSARRGGLRPLKLGVRLRVQAHGSADGPLRDPVIRSVELPGRPHVAA
jgi:hypothetical protein